MNIGDKTIALREAEIVVDTAFKINGEGTLGIDLISATYGLPLDDSSKSYHTTVKLSQSLKANESDRFAIKLKGGRIINYDTLKLLEKDSFHYGAYFIQFQVRLLLNNTNESISTEPIIHYFEKNNFYPARKKDTTGMREGEKSIAWAFIRIKQLH